MSHRMVNSDDDDSDDESAPGDGVASLLAKCHELKTTGNEQFKAGNIDAATTTYKTAVERLTSSAAKKALNEWWKGHPDAEDTASPLLASLQTNLAAMHVKAERWEAAVSAATAALKVDPDNVKARFRRGIAHSHTKQFDEAKADLLAVIRADPKNREARNRLEAVQAALKESATCRENRDAPLTHPTTRPHPHP